jgi:hypothetical protein
VFEGYHARRAAQEKGPVEAWAGLGLENVKCAENTRRRDHSAAGERRQGSGAVSLHQHDPPHRPAGDALDVGLQLDLASPAATTIVAHALYDITE